MTIEQVRYFLAVADTASFTRAAKRCGIAQPSLSQQIQQLERHLRHRLFDRLPKQVLLTDAGRELLPRARRLIQAFEELRQSPAGGELRGSLTVSAVSTVAPFIVAQAVAEFLRQHPAVNLTFQELPPEIIRERIRDGACDVGILVGDVPDPQILVEALFSELLVVAAPAKHPLARRDEITLDDLAHHPVILLDELKEILPAKILRAHTHLRGSGLQVATVEALVSQGAGICLLPAMARPKRPTKGVVYRPLRPSDAARQVNAASHRDRLRSAPATTFMNLLRATVARTL
jgi:LysR family hydrogen peroxide-inducible transcriptional activator